MVVGGAIASELSAIFVGLFVAVYVAVAAFHIYGRAFWTALGRGREVRTAGEVPTA